MRRVQSGQSGEQMTNQLAGNFGGVPLNISGDWTDRVAKGDYPKAKPPRPSGVERNIVITSWEGRHPTKYLHDLIFFGPAQSDGQCLWAALLLAGIFDDNCRSWIRRRISVVLKDAVADPEMPESLGPGHAASVKPLSHRPIGASKNSGIPSHNHNSMLTRKAGSGSPPPVRGLDNPAFCKQVSDHPSAKCSRWKSRPARWRCSIQRR